MLTNFHASMIKRLRHKQLRGGRVCFGSQSKLQSITSRGSQQPRLGVAGHIPSKTGNRDQRMHASSAQFYFLHGIHSRMPCRRNGVTYFQAGSLTSMNTIKTIAHRRATGQPNLDAFSLETPFQMILGRVCQVAD